MLDPDLPARSDDDLLRLVRELLAEQSDGTRTTWVLLLDDDDDRPLPQPIPVCGMPVDPDPEDVERFADTVRMIAQAVGAARAVIVWERPGPGAIRMQEADWIAGLAAADVPLRAQLLATDDGVRLLDPAFEPIVAV